jgi:hypothetical protein
VKRKETDEEEALLSAWARRALSCASRDARRVCNWEVLMTEGDEEPELVAGTVVVVMTGVTYPLPPPPPPRPPELVVIVLAAATRRVADAMLLELSGS